MNSKRISAMNSGKKKAGGHTLNATSRRIKTKNNNTYYITAP